MQVALNRLFSERHCRRALRYRRLYWHCAVDNEHCAEFGQYHGA